jgi:hypothetical protein
VLQHFWAPKPENFLSLKKNYFNTLRKHGTTANNVSHEMLQLRVQEIARMLNIAGNKFRAKREQIDRFRNERIFH